MDRTHTMRIAGLTEGLLIGLVTRPAQARFSIPLPIVVIGGFIVDFDAGG